MPLELWSDDNARQMKTIETRVSRMLVEYRSNTEAALIAFVGVRIARTMLRLYPKPTEAELRRLCVAFLNGETNPKGVESDTGLWMPDQVM